MDDDNWDPLDHAGMRKRIEDGTIEEWSRVFPQAYGSIRVEAKDLRLAGKPHFTLKDQQKALMENRMLSRPLKADLALYDRESGALLDEKPAVTLMRVPYYTDRGTFVYNGNNFTGTTQSRLIPGGYTRRQNNGGLEVQFNTRAATGKVFRVGLDQDTGQFRLNVGGSKLHLYSVLKDAGVEDEELADAWGPEVLELNRARYDARSAGKAFQKFVPNYEQAGIVDPPAKLGKLLEALDKAQIATKAADRTLAAYWRPRSQKRASASAFNALLYSLLAPPPKQAASAGFDVRELGDTDDEGDTYRPIGLEGLLASSRKLLAVNRGDDQVDNRNLPAFSKLYTMDKLMRERIRLDEGKLRRGILRMVNARKNLSPLSHRAFDPYYLDVITRHPTTTPIEETNPLQAVAQHRRVTQMGPGGIGSDDAVTADMQAVNAADFGFYSPLEGPESQRLGVDVRLAWGTKIGRDGRLRRPALNRRTGLTEMVSADDLFGKFLKLPD